MQKKRPAMAIKLYGIGSRIGSGRAHDGKQYFVQALARHGVTYVAKGEDVAGAILNGLSVSGLNNARGDPNGFVSAEPDKADSALSHGRGDRADGSVRRGVMACLARQAIFSRSPFFQTPFHAASQNISSLNTAG